jgi:uncharacterized protein (TIGR03663 family)
LITRLAIIVGWIGVIALGAVLRFEHLSARPVHADEATGARITSKRLEAGDYRFDPLHYHGPTMSILAASVCRMRGEGGWKEMTKESLRLLPAVAGILVLLVPLLGRRRWGDGTMLLAALLLATSPLLVYYSRMFIHEMLLVLFGLPVVMLLAGKPRLVAVGVLLGLMFATKESVAISGLAWLAAGLLVALEARKEVTAARVLDFWRNQRVPLVLAVVSGALMALLLYTDFLRNPQGAADSVKTFFVYKTEAGHDKGIGYYPGLLLWPSKAVGRWWFETGVFVLALAAVAGSFRRGAGMSRLVVHFLAWSVLAHVAIYSCFGYKTPWLMCLPWAQTCLLAGFSIWRFTAWKPALRIAVGLVIFACVFLQVRQTRWTTGRFANDARNPYAYVPTSADVENLQRWLAKIRAVLPEGERLEPVGVVGSRYWPLPWYLREFNTIGYWPEAAAVPDDMPLVIGMPEVMGDLNDRLEGSHEAVPRSLRSEVPVMVYLRKDIWKHWIESPAE